MSVLNRLASALGRRDEIPNQELARQLFKHPDPVAVKELVDHLQNKDKAIHTDCIKVLYELGYLDPAQIALYLPAFLSLLSHPNNRMIWGAMTALDAIAAVDPAGIYAHLPTILDAADKGSVITKDHGVGILVKLAAQEQYHAQAMPILLEQLRACAQNQFPMYVEKTASVVSDAWKQAFLQVLQMRLPELDKASKQKRVEKVMGRLK